MPQHYHILNGDALKEQFPPSLAGDFMVARECLVEGPVHGATLEDFFDTRAAFLEATYGLSNGFTYHEKVVPEFRKMQKLSQTDHINLWFEDDLFCQVNFWFVVYLLLQSHKDVNLFLVRPPAHSSYGFGGLSTKELEQAFQNKIKLTKLPIIADLWVHFKTEAHQKLLTLAQSLTQDYPFIITAVEAHLERFPKNGELGRPLRSLLEIKNELNTEDFATVFREFCKREAIYGFGDSQVMRLWMEIKN